MSKLHSAAVRLKATRYLIHDEIGRGNMGIVYRAVDRMNGQEVALKEVTTVPDQLAFETRKLYKTEPDSLDLRVSLAREFGTLASMRHPNIISVLDYGFDSGQPYFTMEYLKNAETIIESAKDASFYQKINLLAQMLHALVYLHRRNIIHRDLKPENILVVGGHLKILDFGLAMAQSQQEDSVAGTIAYIAPEVLSGEPATLASDLYAVGVITYQILAGRHPFETNDLTLLVEQTLKAEPDVDSLNVDKRLAAAISKMLSKKPEDRFQDAREVLDVYAEVTGMPVQQESSTMRKGFLESAHFIGREAELQQLTQSLDTVIDDYQGSAWLIAGESGVGKSRLLEEVRTRALVKGMTVLRGQAVEEGNVAYALWREPARALCLGVKILPDEARILRSLLPDIAELLDIELESEKPKPRQTIRELLFDVVEGLFRRYEEPTLLILEDLQWAEDSLFLVKRLAQLIKDLPIVLMSSFRNDESPNLPETLSDMNLLTLGRLSPDQMADLSASMLGEETGRNPDILQMLEQETEGNVLFIVEVVRTLAERAGQLDQIIYKTLPSEIFSGSIQTVVERRLQGLPEDMIRPLRIAALAGRNLDVKLLEQVIIGTEFTLDTWLLECSNAAVLEIKQDQWRFVHDKIRTALISALTPQQEQSIHAQIAEALEESYADAKIQQDTRIAYHWEKSGQLARSILYLVKAAEASLQAYSSEDVISYLNRAITLQRLLQQQNLPTHVTKEQRAHWERLLGEATDGMGDHAESKRHYQEVLSILDPDGSGTTISDYSKMHNSQKIKMTEEQADALYSCERLLMLYLHDGQWSQAESIITRMSTIYFGIGDQRSWISTLVTTAWIDFFQGNFTGAERGFKQSFTIGRLRKLPTMVVSGGSGLLMVTARRGQFGDALQKRLDELEKALESIEQPPDSEEQILLAATRAFAYFSLGKQETARTLVKEGLGHLKATPRSHLFDLVAYTSLAETLLDLWEDSYSDDTLEADTRRACKAIHIFAQVVPIARPRAWIYQGFLDWLMGKKQQAQRTLQTAAILAQQLDMPYDEAIAYYRLALYAEVDDPKRNEYIEKATHNLEELGAFEQLRKLRLIQADTPDSGETASPSKIIES